MKILKSIQRPFEGTDSITVYETESEVPGVDPILYPVDIDQQRVYFFINEDGQWESADPDINLSDDQCQYIGDMIESATK